MKREIWCLFATTEIYKNNKIKYFFNQVESNKHQQYNILHTSFQMFTPTTPSSLSHGMHVMLNNYIILIGETWFAAVLYLSSHLGSGSNKKMFHICDA